MQGEAEALVFGQLLSLPLNELQSMRAVDCFFAFFVDANAKSARDAVVHVIGRDGVKPGHRLSLLSLVGRRVALRALDDKKMHLATVTKYERTQWVSRCALAATARRALLCGQTRAMSETRERKQWRWR